MRAAQANLDRLRVLEQYKRIVAPFDGLVTARTTDVGALINAGAGGGPPLFVVSETQQTARLCQRSAELRAEHPGRHQGANLGARISGQETFRRQSRNPPRSVDIASGTTRMQLVVDNSRGELMTGDFTNVTFDLPHPEIAMNVPASALIFNQSGLHVAIVAATAASLLKQVTIARDLGNEVEIGSGIAADDRVVINPPDGIATGDKVRIAGAPGRAGRAGNRRG